MSKYKSPIGGSGKRTTNQFYRSGISSLLSRIEKLEHQVFCCSDDTAGVIDITTATYQANATTEDGVHYIFNKADGITLTLPEATAANIGWNCTVSIGTTGSSSLIINTARTTDLYTGGAMLVDPDTATDMNFFQPDVSDDDAITMSSAARGWLAGGVLRFKIVAANRVFVDATLVGDGSLATVFS